MILLNVGTYVRTYGCMSMVESHFSNSQSLEVTYSIRILFEEVPFIKKKQSNRLQIENVSTVPVPYEKYINDMLGKN